MRIRYHFYITIGLIMGLYSSPAYGGNGGGPFVSGMLRGTEGTEVITDAVLLKDGNLAVCGWTDRAQAWDEAPGLQHIDKGGTEAFVAVVTPDLQRTISFTLLGGSSDDKATAITASDDGTLYVVGTTESPNFPTTSSTIDPMYNANVDGFLACIESDLLTIRFATYIGGAGNDVPHDIVLDAGGTIYICGETSSGTGFPNNNGLFKTIVGNSDGFVMRLSPNAATIQFSTYFGGTSNDSFKAMVLDNSGTIVLTGTTSSADFPMYPAIDTQWWWYYKERPYDWTYNEGDADALLTVLSQDGARAISSTYFGGTGMDEGVGVALVEGTIYILGTSNSADLPTLAGQQMTSHGKSDAFLASFNDNGRTLTSCTYLGGTGDDVATSLSVYRQGLLLVVGNSASNDFPARGHLTSSDVRGGTDGFVYIGNTSNQTFSTTIGGGGNEQLFAGITLSDGGMIALGSSSSTTIELSNTTLIGNGEPPSTDAVAFQVERGGIDLGQPYGGERFCSGSVMRFSWVQSEMDPLDRFEIQYSTDGVIWNTLVDGISGSKYDWKVAPPITMNQAYFFRVKSTRGHTTETNSSIQLDQAPTISTQPVSNAVLCPGVQTVLHAKVEGNDVDVIWIRDNTELSDETADSLVLTENSRPGSYAIRYSAACGVTGTSSACKVVLGKSVIITSQVVGDTVPEGAVVSLSVSATGSGLSYQWYRNNEIITNAVSKTLILQNVVVAQSGTYHCLVTGDCNAVASDPAAVLVTTTSATPFESPTLLTAYPNPASDQVTLVTSDVVRVPTTVAAFNTVGDIVGAWPLTVGAFRHILSVSDIPVGTYQFVTLDKAPLRWVLGVIR